MRLFPGLASARASEDEARQAAQADAHEQAAAYMETHVRSEFRQFVRDRLSGGEEFYGKVVELETQTVVSSLLRGAERAARPWVVRYSDGTYDCTVLRGVPEKNLNPIISLIRGLRLASARDGSPAATLKYMEGILSLFTHDKLAQFNKARALEKLGREVEALVAYEELRRWNDGPDLDLPQLYTTADLPVPPSAPASENLDEIIFGLKPHWENLTGRIMKVAENRRNASLVEIFLNRHKFYASAYGEDEYPIHVKLSCPDDRPRWAVLFAVTDEGIGQVNLSAPRPDRIPEIWEFPLSNRNGKVVLLAFASEDSNTVAFSDLDTASEIVSRDKIRNDKDRKEIARLEKFVRLIEDRAEGGSLVAAIDSFVQEP